MNPWTEPSDGADYPPVSRDLMAVGLLGACYQLGDDAQKVNDAVEATLTDPAQYRMYRALAQGIGGDSSLAAAEIERRTAENADDDKAKVALAVSMMLAGNPEWKTLIDGVLATSTDQAAREGATQLIQYLADLNR